MLTVECHQPRDPHSHKSHQESGLPNGQVQARKILTILWEILIYNPNKSTQNQEPDFHPNPVNVTNRGLDMSQITKLQMILACHIRMLSSLRDTVIIIYPAQI